MRRVCLSAALGLGVLAVGCQRGPELAAVEGTVKLGGKPIEKVHVEFVPDAGGPAASGVTDAAGHYTLTALTGAPGAVVGSHKVVLKDLSLYPEKILGRKAEGMDFSKGHKVRFAAKYGDLAHTPVARTVAAGQPNTIDIDIP